MKIIEFGQENSKVIMLLHGIGLSWWNYRDVANLLKRNYHVVLPVLDGHPNSDTPFTTIEDNAKSLIHYIDVNFGGEILAIGGISLGGQVLVEMLSQRSNICRFAIVESALVVPRPLAVLIAPTVSIGYGLTKKRWFSEMQYKSLNIPTVPFEEFYSDNCKIKKQDMIRFIESNSSYAMKTNLVNTTANVLILMGDKEQKIMKRSAKLLHKSIPTSQLKIFNQSFNGEVSFNNSDDYVGLLTNLLSDEG